MIIILFSFRKPTDLYWRHVYLTREMCPSVEEEITTPGGKRRQLEYLIFFLPLAQEVTQLAEGRKRFCIQCPKKLYWCTLHMAAVLISLNKLDDLDEMWSYNVAIFQLFSSFVTKLKDKRNNFFYNMNA